MPDTETDRRAANEIVSTERMWIEFTGHSIDKILFPRACALLGHVRKAGRMLLTGVDFYTMQDGSVVGDCVAHWKTVRAHA